MRRLLWVAALCAWIAASSAPAQSVQDSVRIQRLVGLCKVWGAAKYFHPYLAEKYIDWDKALVEAIPKVEAARSAEAYRDALNSLFAYIGDSSTRAFLRDSEPPSASPGANTSAISQPYVKYLDDRIAVVTANDWSQFDLSKMSAMQNAFTEAASAKAIVLDLRNLSKNGDSTFWYTNILLQSLPALLSQDVILASARHRMYSGYPTQTGGGYRNYYGAFVNEDASTLRATSKHGSALPIAILINSESTGLEDVLTGLQSAHAATIVQDGSEPPSAAGGFYSIQLTDGVNAVIRTGEFVNPDGTLGFAADLVVPAAAHSSAVDAALEVLRGTRHIPEHVGKPMPPMVVATLEKPYPEMTSPSEEYRLLALFRLYHVINYFYPYKQLFDRPWDDVLTEYIPKLQAAEGQEAYALTIARLVSNIHDSHGAIRSTALQRYLGTYQPPLEVKSVQGQTVVTHLFEESARQAGLSVGNVILSIDGEEISARRQRLSSVFAASTPQALRRRVDAAVLGGAKASQIKLRVRDGSDRIIDATLTCSMTPKKALRETPVYSVLPSGFGYIDLERLTPLDVDAAFEMVKNTPGLIFDIRGYPKGVFMALASRFIDTETVVARFETPTPQSPDPREISRVQFVQTASPSAKWKYRGKVVALINEEAISQSEHTCLILEATAHAKFVGSPTNGANGDVTQTVLPDDIVVNFSGHDVRHADGRQLQRLGIQPDVLVTPTIEGIRAGRDEVLEKAVTYLKGNEEK